MANIAIRPYPLVDLTDAVLFLPGVPGNGSQIDDLSGSGNHGAITGATWVFQNGLPYLDFDGSSKITIPGSQLFNTSQGAIKLWFKTSNSTKALWCSADTATNNYYFSALMYAGGVVAIIQVNNDTASNIRSSTGGYADDTWHLGIFISTGTAYRINIDGVELGIDVNTGANNGDWFADTDNRDDFKFGLFYRTTEASHWVGGQALQRITERVPTTEECLALYNKEKAYLGLGGSTQKITINPASSAKIAIS